MCRVSLFIFSAAGRHDGRAAVFGTNGLYFWEIDGYAEFLVWGHIFPETLYFVGNRVIFWV